MVFRIEKANDPNLRKQITDALNALETSVTAAVSDTVYGAGWNGVTTVAPSKNAVYDKIETVIAATVSDTAYAASWDGVTAEAPSKNAVYDKINAIETGYFPAMMKFDGSTGYYNKPLSGWAAPTGNAETFVLRFAIATSGAAQCFYRVDSTTFRVFAQLLTDGKILIYGKNAATTTVYQIQSVDTFGDGQSHTIFFSIDANAGTCTFRVDGSDQDDLAYGSRVLSAGQTLDASATGTTGNIGIGATAGGSSKVTGSIGFAGRREAYLTNWSDFMQADGTPKNIESTLNTVWGAQPLFWNPHGQMTNNLGSAGAMTKNGTIDLWLPGFGITGIRI